MRKVLSRLLLVLVGVVLLVVAGTLVPRPLRPPAEEPKTRRILVLANPIRTDIAIPLSADVRERFAFLLEAGIPISNPAARWVVFGWGGRAFYLETPTWADLKPHPVFKALTLDRSVMHIDVAGLIPEPHPVVTGFDIGDAAFGRLMDFVEESFEASNGGPILIMNAGYGATDQFFEAKGRFNALVGCNTWTARALREAGLRTGWWNPLPKLLVLSLKLYN
jgi:uncharacterized protein (TIGR02117 family)